MNSFYCFYASLFLCGLICMCLTCKSIPRDHPAIARSILESFSDSFDSLPRMQNSGEIVYSDFIKVHGLELMLRRKPFFIKGICFGNQVRYYNNIPFTHHEEKDFARIAGWGANCVRFYMNEYWSGTEEGFKWLDLNIQWAKANNILLILNMLLSLVF